jgi:hypothetical protein
MVLRARLRSPAALAARNPAGVFSLCRRRPLGARSREHIDLLIRNRPSPARDTAANSRNRSHVGRYPVRWK